MKIKKEHLEYAKEGLEVSGDIGELEILGYCMTELSMLYVLFAEHDKLPLSEKTEKILESTFVLLFTYSHLFKIKIEDLAHIYTFDKGTDMSEFIIKYSEHKNGMIKKESDSLSAIYSYLINLENLFKNKA